jgi:hypothetical protein
MRVNGSAVVWQARLLVAASGHGHHDALRRLASRLVGILHGCLKTRTRYGEDTAWGHRGKTLAA